MDELYYTIYVNNAEHGRYSTHGEAFVEYHKVCDVFSEIEVVLQANIPYEVRKPK